MTSGPKIGVFDSGIGGQSVINAIKKELPGLQIVYKDDKKHLPYGTKTVEQIHLFVKPIFQEFIDEGCQAIVVACNTVTTNLISELRLVFDIPMVGMEPAVKPAAEATRSKSFLNLDHQRAAMADKRGCLITEPRT